MAHEPRVSGFSIVRGARELDYPALESLRSLLPLAEEVVVVAHCGDEETLEMLRSLGDERLLVVPVDWDEGPRGAGRTLAWLTNLALARCRHPWALYLQADEVIHEADYDRIRRALERYDGAGAVDALSFRFLHFEGSYGYVNPLRYRRQCRLVRNDGRFESVRDAAGFGRADGRRLRTRSSGARIFHYGWARRPDVLKAKTLALARLYHDEKSVARRWGALPAARFGSADLAFRWSGRHPAVMQTRIALGGLGRVSRRGPLDSPLLRPRFYAMWLRKWGVLPRWTDASPR
ncbi:MAG: hypothetical protein ABSG61_02995 [Gemmatimonadales bacterium]